MSDGLTFEEALELTSEPMAVFDENAVLRISNAAFREALRPLAGFLVNGTPWTVFLSEAVRKTILSEADASVLRVIEERYLDRPDAQPEVTAAGAGGVRSRVVLRRTSDDGFVVSLTPVGAADDASESELEEVMSKVLHACPTCLIMSGIGDGRILYRSPAATELLGKGFDSAQHFAIPTERADFLAALLPTERIDDMRITARGKEGATFPATISARIVDYRGEDVIVASISDLSEQIGAATEIERQKKQLFQLEKMSALGEVLSGIAHELNNPLSVVVGNAHLLLEEDIADDLRPRIERMTHAAERCVRIVRAFLSMARDRPLKLETHEVSELIGTAVEAFEASEQSNGIKIDLNIADAIPKLQVDEVQIVQVFLNILSNAAQAMSQAGKGSCISIEVVPNSSGVCVRFIDDGPGVPPDIRDRIFDPLFTTKAAGKGTGLGLALCHRIVIAHGGAIELSQQTGRGAVFIVELPTGRA